MPAEQRLDCTCGRCVGEVAVGARRFTLFWVAFCRRNCGAYRASCSYHHLLTKTYAPHFLYKVTH